MKKCWEPPPELLGEKRDGFLFRNVQSERYSGKATLLANFSTL